MNVDAIIKDFNFYSRKCVFLGEVRSFQYIKSIVKKYYVGPEDPEWPVERRKAWRKTDEYRKWHWEFVLRENKICQATKLTVGDRAEILQDLELNQNDIQKHWKLHAHHKPGVRYDSFDYDDYILCWEPIHILYYHRPEFCEKELGIKVNLLDERHLKLVVMLGIIG